MSVYPDTKNMIDRHIRPLIAHVQRRLQGEEGFTLIELMIVLLTLGILMTVAVPTFLSFKDRSNKAAAKQQISQAYRAVQSYKADNFPGSRNDPDAALPGGTTDTGFSGIAMTSMRLYDTSLVASTGIVINPLGFPNPTPTTDFCLTATSGRWTAVQHGENATIKVGTLFNANACDVS